MQANKQISRKDFLKGVGKTVAGVAVAGSVGSILTGCSTNTPTASTASGAEKPEWPFKYQKADPEKAAERAYKGYKEKGG